MMPIVLKRALFCVSLAILSHAASPSAVAQEGQPIGGIQDLAPPKPAKPPQLDEGAADEPLQKKREARQKREEELKPKPVPFAKKQQENLRKEALTPRPRAMLMELSLALGAAQTRGSREGYTSDPNPHFGAFFRKGGAEKDGKSGLWYGFRLAPFTGTGFQNKRPGVYGLTYFGPMIGVGKIDPVPQDDGSAKASATDGQEPEIPGASGWLVAFGAAAVTKVSRSEDPDLKDPSNDFYSKGLGFDGPGAWMEFRYLKVLYGGLGVNFVAGVQTGRQKLFLYAGPAIGFWD